MNKAGAPFLLVSIEAFPPVAISTHMYPESVDDDFNPEFEYIHSPGSRFPKMVYKYSSPRTLKFKLRFDSNETGVQGFDGKPSGHIEGIGIEGILAQFEILKTPKIPLVQAAFNLSAQATNFGLFSEGNEPAPPIAIMWMGRRKLYSGYMKSKITPLLYDPRGAIKRAEVDCEFLCVGDSVFTLVDDAVRAVYSVFGYGSAANITRTPGI